MPTFQFRDTVTITNDDGQTRVVFINSIVKIITTDGSSIIGKLFRIDGHNNILTIDSSAVYQSKMATVNTALIADIEVVEKECDPVIMAEDIPITTVDPNTTILKNPQLIPIT